MSIYDSVDYLGNKMKKINEDTSFKQLSECFSNIFKDEESEAYKTKSSIDKDVHNFKISESYLIGFDYGCNDVACLTVIKRNKDKLVVVNTLYGEEAIQTYNFLTARSTTIKDTTEKIE